MSAGVLAPLHAYRHPCAQLLGGIVAGDVRSIIKAIEVQDRLDHIVDELARGMNPDEFSRVVYEAAGAGPMSLAISIALHDSEHIDASCVDLPDVATIDLQAVTA